VLQALADLDSGVDHPFGQPTGYELAHEGKRYPPKTVIGLACKYSMGRVLMPEEFGGGEAPGQANFVLRRLGFTVIRKGEPEQEPETAKDWSQDEVRLIVADYFAMLEAELNGQSFRKSEHRKALIPQLSGRSGGSVEFKHQNVSAVLVEMGPPYVEEEVAALLMDCMPEDWVWNDQRDIRDQIPEHVAWEIAELAEEEGYSCA
jgi:hypothetical protein